MAWPIPDFLPHLASSVCNNGEQLRFPRLGSSLGAAALRTAELELPLYLQPFVCVLTASRK